jgi:hypothetical protein
MVARWPLAEAFRVSSSQPIRELYNFMAGIAQYRLGKMVAHLHEEVNISILTFLKISHEMDCDI